MQLVIPLSPTQMRGKQSQKSSSRKPKWWAGATFGRYSISSEDPSLLLHATCVTLQLDQNFRINEWNIPRYKCLIRNSCEGP